VSLLCGRFKALQPDDSTTALKTARYKVIAKQRSFVLTIVGLVAVVLWPLAIHAQIVSHGVSAANIQVIQHDSANNTNSVSLSTSLSVNGLSLREGSNRGDYSIQIGPGYNDDAATGALMSCVRENGRNNNDTNYPGTNFCTSSVSYTRSGANSGAYFIPVFNAPSGGEFNINVAAAYFPYSQWIGGYASNSGDTNSGANNQLIGSPGLILGTHFVDEGDGVSTVNLKSFGIDSRTNGVLLVTHGGNEDNYALSEVNTDGTWRVYVKDNGADSTTYEQDPVAFVFVPKANTNVISGRFQGDGTRLMFSGPTPRFTVTSIGTGRWRLTIPGHSPESGVLILSPEGGVAQNVDNIVSYQSDGTTWIIESRDLPSNPPNPQTPSAPVASFVFIPGPIALNLVTPAHNATNQPTSSTLQITVSNAPANASIAFYGRKAAVAGPDFAIALLPDTQFYTGELNGGVPEMFFAQAEWIISNRVDRNIAYVAQLGDISQNGDIRSGSSNSAEWRNATNAMYRLEDPARTLLSAGIPYGVAVGNHDQEPIGTATGTTLFYNQYFGISHFTGKPYYAGHYGTNNDNHFDFFSAGGLDFVALYFEFDTDPDQAVLAWGNDVLRTNAHRRAIVVTHSMGNTQTPLSFSSQGAALYNALKTNSNLFLMLGGHVTGEGSRVDTFNGNVIRTYVQDFQGWTNGGNGFMRTMDFSPSNNQVVVQTFSPWSGEYETDENSEFFFDYNMQPTNAAAFSLLDTVAGVSNGVVSITWPNLQTASTYEWYVVVTDSSGTITTSPTWRFLTTPNATPIASNGVVMIPGDEPANLALSASDPEGNTLTFISNTLPTNGLTFNFNTNTGTFTYVPAHGFRGSDRLTFYVRDSFSASSPANLVINVVAPADTNANSLPDAWETKYGVTNPDGDNDGDGRTNLQEFLANTNPTNAASVLRINYLNRAQSGNVTLGWPTVGGTRYRVQYSNGELLPGAFTDIIRPIHLEMDSTPNDATSSRSFVDDFTLSGGSATNATRYYRIRTVQ
jgi:hypothetical protein